MKIVLIQMAVTDEEDYSLRMKKADGFLTEIESSAKKPDLILFPELWGCGFQNYAGYEAAAEDLQGDFRHFMSRWSRRLHCYIHSGSFVEKRQKETEGLVGTEFYNTSLLFDREGSLKGIYRKIHLFGFESMEQRILTAGNQVTEMETEFGNTGMSTCYDLRFPEQFRFSKEHVPDLFLVTAAWPQARLGHWRLFNQVRAVENQCCVISCNAVGTQCGVTGAGHSMVTDPWGSILAEGTEKEELIWCDLDMSLISECRNRFPALKDRKDMIGGKL